MFSVPLCSQHPNRFGHASGLPSSEMKKPARRAVRAGRDRQWFAVSRCSVVCRSMARNVACEGSIDLGSWGSETKNRASWEDEASSSSFGLLGQQPLATNSTTCRRIQENRQVLRKFAGFEPGSARLWARSAGCWGSREGVSQRRLTGYLIRATTSSPHLFFAFHSCSGTIFGRHRGSPLVTPPPSRRSTIRSRMARVEPVFLREPVAFRIEGEASPRQATGGERNTKSSGPLYPGRARLPERFQKIIVRL